MCVSIQQAFDFRIAAIEFGRKDESFGHLMFARNKVLERYANCERSYAFVQISADADGALVALLCILFNQFVYYA